MRRLKAGMRRWLSRLGKTLQHSAHHHGWGAIPLVLLAAACAGGSAVRQVDVGGHALRVRTAGSGSPTVVFDAGLGESLETWDWVWPQVRNFASVVVYDRAGLGRSESGPSPRTSGTIAGELFLLLERLPAEPPYVLVGHSFGGLNVRLFASRYPDVVAGLVLVDSTPETFPDRARSLISPEERRRLDTVLGTGPAAAAQELDGVETSAGEVAAAGPLPGVPVIVLSSSRPDASREFGRLWKEMQRDLAQRLGAEHVVVENTGHHIQVDAPGAVVRAIRRVLLRARLLDEAASEPDDL